MKKKMNGYMSVEASIIMSWMLFLMVFLIYTSFYLYDEDVMFQDTYSIAFRGSIKPLSTGKIKDYIDANIDKQYGKKYFCSGGVHYDTRVSSSKVTIHVSQTVKHPFGSVNPTLTHKAWNMEDTVEVQILNPTKVLRGIRRVEHLIGAD